MLSLALTACFALGAGDRGALPDRVTLDDGTTLEGRVLFEDEQTLVLRVKSRDREIDRGGISAVRAASLELPRALDRIEELQPGDAAGHLRTAGRLEELNLPLEADLLYWRILLMDPDNAAANAKLGHRKRGNAWVIPHRGRWYSLQKLDRPEKKWGDAWEIETTHYRVRTNLSLSQGLDIAVDLERFYRDYYSLLAKEIGLYHVVEPMDAWVHADSVSFPESSGRGAYFAEPDNRLYVDASSGLQPEALVHEATHQILYNGAVKGSKGFCSDVPAWLDEGLAVYVQAARSGDPGNLVVRPDTLDPRWFSIHAQAEKPYDLSRVLNFDSTDFQASSKADLKYAQSYSLVCFLMYGAQGRHRAGFMEFVKGVYRGKTSSTHLKRAIDVRERDLEKAWHAFAEGMAR